ncbi:TatD family hydrolase [Hydrogenophaga sp.]|uniref:TatD family hydrolase n=1 Tax=Hydrogenophaga sp. TaxID=1904254 RepID=UPI0019BC4A52|nr:TatD family hydrolase [Hydrogenophaga sp.]MBD3894148.1 TatD family deoxyribonuclease [Hydrogenophaga sp.]
MWIDTHCHLDAPAFGPDHALAIAARARAAALGVQRCVLPAVQRSNWGNVCALAQRLGDAYALGIHPLFVPQAKEDDLAALDAALEQARADPHLVAVGEIGLDFFVPALCEPAQRERQLWFCRQQLRLARKHRLPVILHLRRSADAVLQLLREQPPPSGIAHAFNGSAAQAEAFLRLGCKLGFGGALSFEAALRLRRLAATLPLSALVLETDAPDMPPQWLYVSAAQRAAGHAQSVNSPAELPRMGALLAELRGLPPAELAAATCANALAALPRLGALTAQPNAGDPLISLEKPVNLAVFQR